MNRKFFMLFLLYVNLAIFVSVLTQTLDIIPLAHNVFVQPKLWATFSVNLRLVMYLADIVFLVVISNFFKFHIDLVSINRTTIETLELKKNN